MVNAKSSSVATWLNTALASSPFLPSFQVSIMILYCYHIEEKQNLSMILIYFCCTPLKLTITGSATGHLHSKHRNLFEAKKDNHPWQVDDHSMNITIFPKPDIAAVCTNPNPFTQTKTWSNIKIFFSYAKMWLQKEVEVKTNTYLKWDLFVFGAHHTSQSVLVLSNSWNKIIHKIIHLVQYLVPNAHKLL